MGWLQTLAQYCGYISGVIAFAAIIFKPLRDRLFGIKDLREALKCILRADMLHAYYKHHNEDKIRQHEKENFILEYKAYKALGGNSFMDDICKEVRSWEVIS